jgi:ribosomal protein S18 acetylase RimI-like enzyme
MQRPLAGEAVGPPYARVHPYRQEWQEAVGQAHNEAFAYHWGSTARTEQAWNDWMTSRTFRPGTSRVCLGPAGEVLAYVLTYQWVDRELYVGQVGTRRSARGQGLARACLSECLRAAAADGEYDQVDLTVDSANPTGAGALYESVGFTAVRTAATYVRDEDPA